jgi:hypothetical protein
MILAKSISEMQIIRCDGLPIDFIAAKEGEEQKLPTFKIRAYNGGIMRVSGYFDPVAIDLTGLTAEDNTPMFLDHEPSQIVGHSEQVEIGASTLDLAGVISGAGDAAAEVIGAAKNKFPWKASVGVQPTKIEYVAEGGSAIVNGKTLKGPLNVARKGHLAEVSFVALAADGKTSVKVAARAAQPKGISTMDEKFLAWLEASGFDAATLTEDQKTNLQATWKKANDLVSPEPEKKVQAKADPVADVVAKIEAAAIEASNRIAGIERVCSEYRPIDAAQTAAIADIKAKALSEKWDVNKTEVAVIKATLPKGPAIHASTHDVESKVIEAAFCMASGLRNAEKAYDEKTLEAASAYQRREGVSLQGLILAAARNNGYEGGANRIHRGNYDSVMRATFGNPMVRAGFSTHTLTTMLSTVGNKFLLEGFYGVEQVWREIASIRPVSDFKAVTAYRMLDDMVFEELPPTGEIKHGVLDQETYTNQAKTYAKMLALPRTDIINDDLGAFNSIRERIGAGSGRKLNSVFWTSFLDDAAFFAAAHGNAMTTALGEAGIAAAKVLLSAQKDKSGDHPIGLTIPMLLLTGATLNPTALKWYVSQEIRDTTASTKTPTDNIYRNKYRPVESAYITSTTSWYLLPIQGGELAPMEVCFLDNVQSPTIESADADFNTLGIQFRGYWDFGVARKEWRASVKSTGAG